MPSREKFQSPTGMHDILLDDELYFQKIEKVCGNIADFYGFKKIETPILEQTELFEKGTGFSTDIVLKQMFSFRTKGGDYLTLRPEGTPGVVRSFIQNGMINLPKPVKLWYSGPFFRYERPQAGRFRQLHQIGFENLGVKNPIVDVQIIQIFFNILKELGFENLIIEINSIGDSQCRGGYKRILANYLRPYQNSLCADCRQRLKENIFRVLDCKEEKCQKIIKGAPQMINYLCEECHNHFKNVLEYVEELGLPYQLNPYLARGLDYYTKTVFEISSSENELMAKDLGALVGGGRYDDLNKILGGKETPACGGALGVERIVSLMKAKGKKVYSAEKPQIFLAQVGESARRESLRFFEKLRKEKIKVAEAFHKDSLSSQMKIADNLGVKYVLILGQKEALNNEIIIKEMETGKQGTVKLERAIKEIKKRLKAPKGRGKFMSKAN